MLRSRSPEFDWWCGLTALALLYPLCVATAAFAVAEGVWRLLGDQPLHPAQDWACEAWHDRCLEVLGMGD